MPMVLVMRQLTAVLEHLMHGVTRQRELTPRDVLVLGWLAQKPGISGSEIAYFVGRSRQSVQKALERFERRALVERYPASTSDRTVGWGLTEQGGALWLEVDRGLRDQERSLQSRGVVTAPFLEGLKNLMNEMTHASRAMAVDALVEPPPKDEVPEWDR